MSVISTIDSPVWRRIPWDVMVTIVQATSFRVTLEALSLTSSKCRDIAHRQIFQDFIIFTDNPHHLDFSDIESNSRICNAVRHLQIYAREDDVNTEYTPISCVNILAVHLYPNLNMLHLWGLEMSRSFLASLCRFLSPHPGLHLRVSGSLVIPGHDCILDELPLHLREISTREGDGVFVGENRTKFSLIWNGCPGHPCLMKVVHALLRSLHVCPYRLKFDVIDGL